MTEPPDRPARQRWLVATNEYAGMTSYTGGIGRHYAALLPALVRAGVDVDLVVCADGGLSTDVDLGGVRLVATRGRVRLSSRVHTMIRNARLVRRAYRRRRYDRVLLPEWSALGSALPRSAPLVTNLATSTRLSNRISGFTLRDFPVTDRVAVVLQDALETHQITRSTALVAISTAMLARTRDLVGDLPPTVVVRNCIDVAAVRIAATTAPLPARWPSGSAPTVLFLGRLERRKGVVEAVSAFARLLEDIPDARLVLAGASGDGRFEPQVAELLDLVPASARDQVVWLGHVPGDELFRAVATASVVMCPSRWEGFGNVALEVRTIGTPLVVTSGSGYDDFCTDGVDCSMVPPCDVGALAEALREILQHPVAARRRASLAAQTVDRYAPDPVARDLVAAVDGLLGPVG